MTRRPLSLVLVFTVLLAAGCTETKTPTEPYVSVEKPASASEASLSGIVTDANGVPQPGLLVTCQGKATHTLGGGVVGFYGFAGLKPGHTTVDVHQDGQKDPTSFDVDLTAGVVNTKNVAVVLFHGRPASLSGRVIPLSARAITDLSVWCQGKSASVAPDGSYSLTGLESGYWDLTIGWDSYEGEFYTNVTLDPGANTRNFSIPY